MKVKKLKNESWRFYFFKESGEDFVFDCFTNKIYSIKGELAELLEKRRYLLIKIKYPYFYNQILEHHDIKPKTIDKKMKGALQL